jgi:GDP-L-fucose synthase
MHKESRIFVAGADGMVGSAIIRKLLQLGYTNIVGSYHAHQPSRQTYLLEHTSDEFNRNLRLVKIDLTHPDSVNSFFKAKRPDYVFLAAARVGGIHANQIFPAEFIYINLAIQTNIIHAAYRFGVERLLFLGSSCIYPRLCPQPIREEHLLGGVLEQTNEPYAVAKIAGIKMCEAYNRQYGTRFLAVMPTNLYGPNDNFDLQSSHVLPALMRKFHEARLAQEKTVEIWGTGVPRREFLHVDDLADACVFVMKLGQEITKETFLNYPSPCFVNVGTGIDFTIRELAEKIKAVVRFDGKLCFDTSKPDGTPKKLLDVSRIRELGWSADTSLESGLEQTYAWYLNSIDQQKSG